MNAKIFRMRSGALLSLALAIPLLSVDAAPKTDHWADLSDENLFEIVCSTCHASALPRSQRLNRRHWEWVISDMINDQGCDFLPEKHMQRIFDYVVTNYGVHPAGP